MACGRRAPKSGLLRFAVVEGELRPDPEGRLPGRGAYLCPEQGCWERAVARRAFARALRAPVRIPEGRLDF